MSVLPVAEGRCGTHGISLRWLQRTEVRVNARGVARRVMVRVRVCPVCEKATKAAEAGAGRTHQTTLDRS